MTIYLCTNLSFFFLSLSVSLFFFHTLFYFFTFILHANSPLPATTGHFWRMIWENQVNIIVMVTGLIEKGAVKCER